MTEPKDDPMYGEPSEVIDLPDDLALKLSELGPPLAEFRAGGTRLFLLMLAGPLLFLLGLALVALPVVALVKQFPAGHAFFKLFVVGLVLLPGAVGFVLRAYRNRGLRVLVFPEGIVRLHQDEMNAAFWDDLTTVWRRKSNGAWAHLTRGSVIYTVVRGDGTEIPFDDHLSNLERLGILIRNETLQHLLPRYQQGFEAGEELDFGKVKVSRAGVSNGTETIPWKDVKEVKVEKDALTIDRAGKWLTWHRASLSDVPNAHVLQALLRERLGNRLVVSVEKT